MGTRPPLPPNTLALRQMIATALITFSIGFFGVCVGVLWLRYRTAPDEFWTWELIVRILETLHIAFLGGLSWRLTDPKYRVFPPAHLAQIQPLDAASAKRLLEMTHPWHYHHPFTQGYFADIASTSTATPSSEDLRRVRKWLYRRGVPFKH